MSDKKLVVDFPPEIEKRIVIQTMVKPATKARLEEIADGIVIRTDGKEVEMTVSELAAFLLDAYVSLHTNPEHTSDTIQLLKIRWRKRKPSEPARKKRSIKK